MAVDSVCGMGSDAMSGIYMSELDWPPFQAGDTVVLSRDFNSEHLKGHPVKVIKIAVWVGLGKLRWHCTVDVEQGAWGVYIPA